MRKIYIVLLMTLLAMPVSATVRYVNASRPDNAGDGLTWTTAHKDLQTALIAAVDGDQIWVAQGTYKPTTSTTDRSASFVMKEGVAIYGGFSSGQMNLSDRNSDPASNGTILSSDIDGDGTGRDNSVHLVYNAGNMLTVRAVLDGFTLSNGGSYVANTAGSGQPGGAMYLESSSPLINRCIFQYFSAQSAGAILCKNSSVKINDCTFFGNTAGEAGAIRIYEGSPMITNCVFKFNIAWNLNGGAIIMSGTGPQTEISGCQFIENRSFYNAGAIYKGDGSLKLKNTSFESNSPIFGRSVHGGAIVNSGSIRIDNCQFNKNYAAGSGGALVTSGDDCEITNSVFKNNGSQQWGGAISSSGNILVRNTLFQENFSSAGGAFYNNGTSTSGESTPRFINCSFLGNSANGNLNPTGNGGGALYSAGGGLIQLTNCIFWKNGGSNTFNYQSADSPFVTRYSLLDASVNNYVNGGNNIVMNIVTFPSPFISDSDARLRPGSLAIDVGLNSANSTTTDLGGNDRIVNRTIDMGAYEFGSNSGSLTITGLSGVNCQELSETARQLTFTPTYTGTDGSPITFSVHGELAETTKPGPYTLRLYKDNPYIVLMAEQGNGDHFSYRYDWLAACGTPPPPPPTGDFAITGVSGVNCQTLSPTARQLTFTPTYQGADGSPITFSVYGEMVETTAPGPYSLRLYKDNPIITLMAKQGNGDQFSYRYDWLAACGTPPPPPPTSAFAITGVNGVNCQTLSPTARQLTFTPTYQGSDGSPITFSVYGEMVETTAPGPYSLRLYVDNPSISLVARQNNGNPVGFQYNWLNVCNAAAVRLAAEEESSSEVQVEILGNPVNDGLVKLEVRGAQGQPLALQLMDMNGRLITERHVARAGSVESHSLEIGHQVEGLLLLRVNTPSLTRTVKILHVR